MFIGFKEIQIIGLPRWQSPWCHWIGSVTVQKSAPQILPMTTYNLLHGGIQSGKSAETTNKVFKEGLCQCSVCVLECDTENTLGTKVSPVCFLLCECLCAVSLFPKVKGQQDSVWRPDAPLGVKSHFVHRGHSRATPGFLHLKTSSISVVRPWNLGCFSSLHVLLSLSPQYSSSSFRVGAWQECPLILLGCKTNLEFDFIFIKCRCTV